LASIVFAILVLREAQLPHTDTVLLAAYVTVGLSRLVTDDGASPPRRVPASPALTFTRSG